MFVTDAVELSAFVRDRGLPNVLDFPLQDALVRFAAGRPAPRRREPARATTTTSAPVGRRPDAADLPRQPRHGPRRAPDRAAGGGAGDELLRRVLLGYDLLYLLRGAPVVYYGDEVGMIGSGGDKAARQDMFPTKVAEWQTEQRVGSPPIGDGSSFDVTRPPDRERLCEALAALRDAHPALATGALDRPARARGRARRQPDRSSDRREYLVVFNASEEEKTMTRSARRRRRRAGRSCSDRSSSRSPATGAAACRSSSAPSTRWFSGPTPTCPSAGPRGRRLRARTGQVHEPEALSTASVAGRDPVSVTFSAWSPRANAWTRLGSDDGAPYRVFLDPRRYREGETVSLVAAVRASDGSVSTSPVLSVRPR